MSFNDPVRLSFEGDRAEAFRYIRPARALLLKLAREVSNAGSATARRRFVLGDGAIIEIGLAGLQSTVHIVTPEAAGARVRVQEHFVVWPREGDPPESIDEDHPQLMIRFADDEFATLFYDADIEGYEDFEGTRGTYRTDRGEVVFPDGVRHAGNVDWRSSEGLRVSWYGPSTRYFLDPYVQPRSQYGTKVFMLGQELFDSDEYMAQSDITFPERWVMGAAITPDLNTLVIVHAELPVGHTQTGEAPPRAVVAHSPFPDTPFNSGLCPVPIVVATYELARDPATSDVMNFSVVPESRNVVASQTLQRALNPWFFDGEAAQAVSSGIALRTASILTTSMGTVLDPPSENNEMFRFDGASLHTTLVSAAVDGEAVLAADFDGVQMRQLVVRRRRTRVPYSSLEVNTDDAYFALDDLEWPVQQTRFTGNQLAQQDIHHRAFMWGDLRAGTFIFMHMHISGTIPTQAPVDMSIETWHRGALTHTQPVDFAALPPLGLPRRIADGAIDGIRAMNQAADVPVAPTYYLYGIQIMFTGLTSILSFGGRHGLYWTTPYPQPHMFGSYALTGAGGGPYTVIASVANDASNIEDFDDKLSVLGAASFEGVTLYSCYDFGARNGAAFHGAAGALPLSDLTGVDGPKARYHPIWLLGILPSREIA